MARARTLTLKTKVEVDGEAKLRGLGRTLQRTGSLLTTGLTLPIIGMGAAMITAAEDAAQAQAKLTNVFKSMGAAAFTSVEALNAQAEALQNATTFDDEAITELQAVLLTFGNVTGDAFTRATAAAVDMSALFEGDLQSAAIQVGKALNDPIKGVTALTRVGVSFTEQQLEQIKTMQRSGDILGAQNIILAELERQFGGTAEALAGTAGGKMTQALNQLGEASEKFGESLAPVLLEVAKGVKEFAKWLQELNPETREAIIRFGAMAAVLGPLLVVFGSLLRVFAPFHKLLTAQTGALGKFATALGTSRLALLGWIGVIAAAGIAVGQGTSEAIDHVINNVLVKLGAASGRSAGQVEAAVARIVEALGVDAPEATKRLIEAVQAADGDWDAAMRSMVAGSIKVSEEAAAAWNNLGQPVAGAIDGISDAFQEESDEAVEIVRRMPGALADVLEEGIDDYQKALDELAEVAVNSVSDMTARQEIEGVLGSKALTDALNSDSTRARLLAQQFVADRIEEYELIAPGALAAGDLVVPAYAEGVLGNIGLAIDASGAIVDAAGAPLADTQWATDAGFNTGSAYADGMAAAAHKVFLAAHAITFAAGPVLRGQSPPKEGPLKDIDKWGLNVGRAWAEGWLGAIPDVQSATRKLAGAVGLGGSIGGIDISRGTSPLAGAPVVNNFYLQWDGEPPKGRNEAEIIANLQRLIPLAGGKLATG